MATWDRAMKRQHDITSLLFTVLEGKNLCVRDEDGSSHIHSQVAKFTMLVVRTIGSSRAMRYELRTY